MNTVMQDTRYALRQLWRSPGYTLVIVLTLAAGIGANAAIFSVVDTVLLRPLGYRNADRIFAINTRFPSENRTNPRLGGDDYVDLSKSVRAIDAFAYYSGGEGGIQVDGQGEYLTAAVVSRQFGQVLGVEPIAGRLFLRSDDVSAEALVSNDFARRHFGSAQSAVGHVVASAGVPHTIVGVLPEGFHYPESTAVWLGGPDRPHWPSRSGYNQRAIVRLRAGSTAAELSAELASLSAQLAASYPEDRDKALVAITLQEQLVGTVRPMLRLLMTAVAVLLLIVCANITHLQLVRSTTQVQRNALLNALGASRARLARFALIQTLLLAALGGVAGVLLGLPLTRFLLRLSPKDLPRNAELQATGVALNGHVLAVCFAVSAGLMLLTAMLPLWRSWHVDPASALKQDLSRGTAGGGVMRLRSGLIVGEVALTFVLCIASALLVQQMRHLAHTELGFRPDALLLADIHVPAHEGDGVNHVQRLQAMLSQLGSTPGISSAAAIMGAPSQDAVDVGYAIHHRMEFTPGVRPPVANALPITPNYLQTVSIPLLRGRALNDADVADAPYVAVITQSMAKQGFSGIDPIGQEIKFGLDETDKWVRIVGIVQDAVQQSPANLPSPTFYVPIAQHPRAATDTQIVLRTSTDPHEMLDTATQRIRAFDPAIAVTMTTMQDSLSDSVRSERFRSTLFGAFALLSVLLAAVGIYSVTTYSVAQRRFEFGLRFAFGAQRTQVFAGVLRHGLALTAAGIAVGSLGAFLLSRLAAFMLTGVEPLSIAPWIAAAVAVAMLMMIATVIPARRAANVNPMQALRSE